MDYTRDAILIEGIKEEENIGISQGSDENAYVDSGGSVTAAAAGKLYHHQKTLGTFSSIALLNSSEYIKKKVMMTQPDLTSVLLMKGNGSLSELAPVSSPSSVLEGQQYDDMMNDTLEYIPMSMRPETYIVPVLFAIIFIIGITGNFTLIVIFIKQRSMRNVPNMFIVSLAIGDLLVILFCVPFTSTVYTVDSWPYGLVVCKFSEFVKDLSVGVSVFTLTALSADRYFAIVDPMRKLTGRRATRITIISIVGIWTLSVLVALPSALYSYIRVFPEVEEGEEEEEEIEDGRTFQVCYPYPTEFGPNYAKVMVMFHFLVYYAVPLFFIATFYIIMARHLVLSTRNMPGEAQGQAKQIQARKKVANMILSFIWIFFICFFPHHLFLLWFYFYPDSENSFNAFWNICRIAGFCLSFMNSCINPITLYCVSGTFRKQFNDHLFCCFCKEPGNRASRGCRFSMGGTLAGGGGHGGGLCAGCVSLSGNHGQRYGNDSRYGNGSLGRDGNRIHRGSTWENSDRMISKRKSTWETQTTVVNHRVLNMANGRGGSIAAAANIHVNLCSEHEHIPLRKMSSRPLPKAAMAAVGTTSPHGITTVISTTVQENELGVDHQCCGQHGHVAPPSAEDPLLPEHLHCESCNTRNSSVNGNEGIFSSPESRKRLYSGTDFPTNKVDTIIAPDNHNNALVSVDGGEMSRIEQQQQNSHNNHREQPSRRKSRPSLIEEEKETICSEQENNKSNNSTSSNKSSIQHSPNKAHSKVGEIFSKISYKYGNSCSSSPTKLLSNHNNETSSPSKKSPTKVAPASVITHSKTKSPLEYHDDGVMIALNFNNNNRYANANHNGSVKENVMGEEASVEECTVTSFITIPENVLSGEASLEKNGEVIKCYD